MVTKMYSMHIGVLFQYDYWTTNMSKDLEMCQMVFAYRGKLKLALSQELDEIILKNDVLLSVVDKKGREHPIEVTDYNSFLNEGPESIECQNVCGDFEVISDMDYYRDGLLPLTIMPCDSDHMSADLPDDAIFLENEPEQDIMDVVAEPRHADQDSESELSVVPDSSKEPESEARHADKTEGEPSVVPDSSKESQREEAHAEQDSECDHIENKAKQGHPLMCDDNNNDSDATIIYEVPKLPKCNRKRKSKAKRQVLQVKTDTVKKKSPKHHFVCRICHHKFAKNNSWYKHEKQHSKTFQCGKCAKKFTYESELK